MAFLCCRCRCRSCTLAVASEDSWDKDAVYQSKTPEAAFVWYDYHADLFDSAAKALKEQDGGAEDIFKEAVRCQKLANKWQPLAKNKALVKKMQDGLEESECFVDDHNDAMTGNFDKVMDHPFEKATLHDAKFKL